MLLVEMLLGGLTTAATAAAVEATLPYPVKTLAPEIQLLCVMPHRRESTRHSSLSRGLFFFGYLGVKVAPSSPKPNLPAYAEPIRPVLQ